MGPSGRRMIVLTASPSPRVPPTLGNLHHDGNLESLVLGRWSLSTLMSHWISYETLTGLETLQLPETISTVQAVFSWTTLGLKLLTGFVSAQAMILSVELTVSWRFA